MRQEPIEMAGPTARRRRAQQTRKRSGRLYDEPRVIDEAFARFDASDSSTSHGRAGDRRVVKQALLSDLAAQLNALDQQRTRLAQLLQSIETNSLAD
jgi:hypothetical protein